MVASTHKSNQKEQARR